MREILISIPFFMAAALGIIAGICVLKRILFHLVTACLIPLVSVNLICTFFPGVFGLLALPFFFTGVLALVIASRHRQEFRS